MYRSTFTIWRLSMVTLVLVLWGFGSPAVQASDKNHDSCGCPAPVVRQKPAACCPAPVLQKPTLVVPATCCPAPVVRQKPAPICCPAPVVRQKPAAPTCCPADPKK